MDENSAFRPGEDGICTSYSPEVRNFLKEPGDRNEGSAREIEIFSPQKATNDEEERKMK